MRIKLARSPEPHAARHSALPAGIGARFDQVALERGKAGQDRHQQLALRVEVSHHGSCNDLNLAPCRQGLQMYRSRTACQPIEAGHDQQVAALQPLHDLSQLGPIGAGT